MTTAGPFPPLGRESLRRPFDLFRYLEGLRAQRLEQQYGPKTTGRRQAGLRQRRKICSLWADPVRVGALLVHDFGPWLHRCAL